jgi:phage gp36-like protein
MAAFIQLSDYDARIHREILDALVRDDETIIEIIEDQSIALMRSYLNNRYDCDAIFAVPPPSPFGEGSGGEDKRNQLILRMALDITVYDIFCIHNPQKMSQITKDRYERAIEWLKQVNAGKANIDGAPLLPPEQLNANSPYLTKSNQKRQTHY